MSGNCHLFLNRSFYVESLGRISKILEPTFEVRRLNFLSKYVLALRPHGKTSNLYLPLSARLSSPHNPRNRTHKVSWQFVDLPITGGAPILLAAINAPYYWFIESESLLEGHRAISMTLGGKWDLRFPRENPEAISIKLLKLSHSVSHLHPFDSLNMIANTKSSQNSTLVRASRLLARLGAVLSLRNDVDQRSVYAATFSYKRLQYDVFLRTIYRPANRKYLKVNLPLISPGPGFLFAMFPERHSLADSHIFLFPVKTLVSNSNNIFSAAPQHSCLNFGLDNNNLSSVSCALAE